MSLIKKTEDYVAAFDQKDLSAVENMFTENITLFDPGNPNGLTGKSEVVKMIKELFQNIQNLSFKAENIFCDNQTTIIEFVIKLDDKTLKGVDIVDWQDNKIKELRAYLY